MPDKPKKAKREERFHPVPNVIAWHFNKRLGRTDTAGAKPNPAEVSAILKRTREERLKETLRGENPELRDLVSKIRNIAPAKSNTQTRP
jgi:hypothetical protein